VPEVADPRGLVDGESDVPLAALRGLARVEADPDPHDAVLRPFVPVQRALSCHRGRNRGRRAREDGEERVALAVDLDPVVLGERAAEQLVVPREDLAVAIAPELLQEPGRPLDVREEKGDRPRREVTSRRADVSTPSEPACNDPSMVLGAPERRKGVSVNLGGRLGGMPDCEVAAGRASLRVRTRQKGT
jgi:hypothetical protein